MTVRGDVFGVGAALIADVASAIKTRIAVQELAIVAGLRHADAIAGPYDGRPIEHDGNPVVTMSSPADQRNHARLIIVAVDPLEAGPLEVDFVERRLLFVHAIQIFD